MKVSVLFNNHLCSQVGEKSQTICMDKPTSRFHLCWCAWGTGCWWWHMVMGWQQATVGYLCSTPSLLVAEHCVHGV